MEHCNSNSKIRSNGDVTLGFDDIISDTFKKCNTDGVVGGIENTLEMDQNKGITRDEHIVTVVDHNTEIAANDQSWLEHEKLDHKRKNKFQSEPLHPESGNNIIYSRSNRNASLGFILSGYADSVSNVRLSGENRADLCSLITSSDQIDLLGASRNSMCQSVRNLENKKNDRSDIKDSFPKSLYSEKYAKDDTEEEVEVKKIERKKVKEALKDKIVKERKYKKEKENDVYEEKEKERTTEKEQIERKLVQIGIKESIERQKEIKLDERKKPNIMKERWDKVVKEKEKELIVKKETPIRKKLLRGSRKKDKEKENSIQKKEQSIKKFLVENIKSTKRKCEDTPNDEKEKVETPGKRQKKETFVKDISKKEYFVKDSDGFNYEIGTVQNLRRQFEDIRACDERNTQKEKEMVSEIGLQYEEKSAKSLKIGPSRKLGNLDTRWEGSVAFKISNLNGPIGGEDFGGKTNENTGLHVSFDRCNPEGKQ